MVAERPGTRIPAVSPAFYREAPIPRDPIGNGILTLGIQVAAGESNRNEWATEGEDPHDSDKARL
jgi:hypothetical protein